MPDFTEFGIEGLSFIQINVGKVEEKTNKGAGAFPFDKFRAFSGDEMGCPPKYHCSL
jgi:hypothetical protein